MHSILFINTLRPCYSYQTKMSGRFGRRGARDPMNDSLMGREARGATNSGTVTTLGVLLALSLAALIAVSIALPLTLGRVATQQCGGVSIRADQLCVDFIVAGGGSAGATAAKRISDDFTQTVLVVEAGSDIINDPEIFDTRNVLETLDVPFFYPYKYAHERVYEIRASSAFRREITTGGRGLGGSSLINTLVAVTGSSDYWDAVDTFVGSPGTFNGDAVYTTNSQLEWLETYDHYAAGPDRGTQESVTNQYKLTSKPRVNDPSDDNHFVANLLSNAYGIPNGAGTQSYNNKDVSLQANPFCELTEDFNTTTFQRWAVRRAFMGPAVMDQTTYVGAAGRQLQVLLNSTVTELLFNPYNPTHCIGVRYTDRDGQSHDVFSRKSVIVSMWWQGTELLQRSGIGPAAVLANAGVTPRVINENVGTQWKTHPHFELAFLSPNVTGAQTDPVNTGSAAGFTTAFMEDTAPIGIPGRRGYQLISATFPSVIGLFTFQLDMAGVGTISINSDDPNQPAIYNSETYSDADDRESIRTFIRDMVTRVTTEDPTTVFLSIDPVTLADDTLLDAWVFENQLLSNYHNYAMNLMCSTAANGAVDPRFRVFGTTGLRVCDTSVLPFPSDGNPTTPAYLIGDICGRMTLEDFGSAMSAKDTHKVHKFETRKTTAPTHKTKNMKKRDVAPRTYTPSDFVARSPPTEQEICDVVRNLSVSVYQRLSKTQAASMMRPICRNYPTCCAPEP